MSEADPRHALLVNPSSARGKAIKLAPEVERELERRGLAFRTVLTRSMEHGVEQALAAVEAGERPVVLSGDGLIGRIGGALADTDAALALIPGGRGNDLARVLGIPEDVPGAVDVLATGDERRIDVAEANGRRFLTIASTGFDAVANQLANEARIVHGNLVYAYAGIRTLATWRPASFTVTLDGEHRIEHRGYSVAAANGRAYGGGMLLAPDAELDDGLFDVVFGGESSKLTFIRALVRVFKGTHVELDSVEVRRASTIEVAADRDFRVYADGEHLTDLPAGFAILPRALRVIAPPAPGRGPGPIGAGP